MRNTQASELILSGSRWHREVVEEPVVERSVVLELEGARRVAHAFDGVALAVREVGGGEVGALRPTESEPLDVTLDPVDVLHPLLCRVRIIEAQVATAGEFLRKLVIQHDRLRVPQVEEAVRLGWKARDHDTRAAGLDVRRYDAANEIAGARARFSAAVLFRHLPPQAWNSSGGCAPKPCILSDH